MSISAGYYRTVRQFPVTDNLLRRRLTTALTDRGAARSAASGGGGYTVDGLADISQQKFADVNLIVPASNFGDQRQVSNFVNLHSNNVCWRGTGRRVGHPVECPTAVSWSIHRRSPEPPHCDAVHAQTDIAARQLSAAGRLPVASAKNVNMSGIPSRPATRRPLRKSCGRWAASAGGARTATVPLVALNTMFEDRAHASPAFTKSGASPHE